MPKRTLLFIAILIAGLALSGPVTAGGKISITGSTTVLPVAQKAAEVFMQKHPDMEISVAGTGSGDGIKAIIDGTADIGDASRDMKEKEVKLAQSKGVTPARHTVALDCIVPIVHPDNPTSNLTLDQLKAIYVGEVKNWKEVGGQDKKIIVISRDSSSGTFEVWNKLVLKKARVRPDAQLQSSNGTVAQAVAGNKYALGYVGIGYLNDQIKTLTVSGVEASAATATNGSYKVARQLFMFTPGEPTGVVKDFLGFVKGPEGQSIVEEEGFVKVK